MCAVDEAHGLRPTTVCVCLQVLEMFRLKPSEYPTGEATVEENVPKNRCPNVVAGWTICLGPTCTNITEQFNVDSRNITV